MGGLLELIDECLPGGVPSGRVKQLQDAGLLDLVKTGVVTANGFSETTSRASRAVVATEEQLREAGGIYAIVDAGSLNCVVVFCLEQCSEIVKINLSARRSSLRFGGGFQGIK